MSKDVFKVRIIGDRFMLVKGEPRELFVFEGVDSEGNNVYIKKEKANFESVTRGEQVFIPTVPPSVYKEQHGHDWQDEIPKPKMEYDYRPVSEPSKSFPESWRKENIHYTNWIALGFAIGCTLCALIHFCL